ncbi:MAG: hypothetical protein JSU86_07120 [Phycisphaerales bacterium]|nr:MAG: hypothetical protein JSU86_07120 [Phycisphaerales bacterium]
MSHLSVILCILPLGCGVLAATGATPGSAHCEVQKLISDDTVPPLYRLDYGDSVALDGDRAVVGALYFDRHPCWDCVHTGFAYVYRHDGARWIPETRLSHSDGTLFDYFGETVSISGDTVVVGGRFLGAAYVFHHEDTGWVQEEKLMPWDGPVYFYGSQVSVSGNVAVVGAGTGAAYVFRRQAGGWAPEQKLDAAPYVALGRSLAVSGDYVLIGSPDYPDPRGGTGAVYVFRYDGGNWIEDPKLVPHETPGGQFGSSIAVHGVRVLIGAPYQDDPEPDTGAAYVFRREGRMWVQEGRLIPNGAGEGDHIGYDLALGCDYALLAQNDVEVGAGTGTVHVFTRSDMAWSELGTLEPRRCDGSRVAVGPVVTNDVFALVVAHEVTDVPDTSGSIRVYTLSEACRSVLDYAAFQRCFSGDGGGVLPGCETQDWGADGDIDLDDYREFLRAFKGP